MDDTLQSKCEDAWFALQNSIVTTADAAKASIAATDKVIAAFQDASKEAGAAVFAGKSADAAATLMRLQETPSGKMALALFADRDKEPLMNRLSVQVGMLHGYEQEWRSAQAAAKATLAPGADLLSFMTFPDEAAYDACIALVQEDTNKRAHLQALREEAIQLAEKLDLIASGAGQAPTPAAPPAPVDLNSLPLPTPRRRVVAAEPVLPAPAVAPVEAKPFVEQTPPPVAPVVAAAKPPVEVLDDEHVSMDPAVLQHEAKVSQDKAQGKQRQMLIVGGGVGAALLVCVAGLLVGHGLRGHKIVAKVPVVAPQAVSAPVAASPIAASTPAAVAPVAASPVAVVPTSASSVPPVAASVPVASPTVAVAPAAPVAPPVVKSTVKPDLPKRVEASGRHTGVRDHSERESRPTASEEASVQSASKAIDAFFAHK